MKLVEILNKFNLDSDFLNEGYTEGGTDKNSYHSYIENFYEKEFEPYKESKIDLLEIGIETGGSLKLWKEYFLNSKSVVGVDISDEKIDQRYKNIDGIIMHFGDAYDEKFSKKFKQFDIIIDDASHIYSDMLNNFKNFFKKVKPGGFYVIEDFNHYKYYSHLNDSSSVSLEIEEIFEHLKSRQIFKSNILDDDFQHYCFNNISEIAMHKGIQNDSYIAFIKKK